MTLTPGRRDFVDGDFRRRIVSLYRRHRRPKSATLGLKWFHLWTRVDLEIFRYFDISVFRYFDNCDRTSLQNVSES
jgi:hypothetical protein